MQPAMSLKNPIRPVIRALEPSGITKVTALGLGDPDSDTHSECGYAADTLPDDEVVS